MDDLCDVICAHFPHADECHDWVPWYVMALWNVIKAQGVANVLPGLATSKPYIQAPDGSQVEWSSFRLVNYIIYDGWRVGLTGSYLVNAVSRYETGRAFSSLQIPVSSLPPGL